MTKQNAPLERICSVKIGVGFKGEKRSTDLYSRDRLTAFLNLNTSNKDSVHDFCDRYLVVPRDLTQGWSEALKTEQEKNRHIAKQVATEKLRITNQKYTYYSERKNFRRFYT